MTDQQQLNDYINMEQVSRSINEKINRDRLRKKIKDLTPRTFLQKERYYNLSYPKQQLPHQILSHQYRHFKYPQYNQNGFISKRQIYSYPEMMIYEPLRSHQLEKQRQKSKKLSMGNQFLKNYDPTEYQIMKERFIKQRKKEEGKQQDDDDYDNKQKKPIIIQQKQERQRKTHSNKSVTLPKINLRKHSQKRSLKSIFIAVYFMTIVRLNLRNYIIKKKKFNQKFLQKYVIESIEAVKEYYYQRLQDQLDSLLQLLEIKNKNPRQNVEKQLMHILVVISQKILEQGIPKIVMKSIMILSTNYSFYPCPFLSAAEIKRLSFSQEFGCTVQVDLDLTTMVSGVYLVIKLFTNYILYRPWEYYYRSKRFEDKDNPPLNFNKLLKFIYEFGSIFYFVGLDQFLVNVQLIQRQPKKFLNVLKKFQIEPILPVILEEKDDENQNSTNRSTTKKSSFTQKTSLKSSKNSFTNNSLDMQKKMQSLEAQKFAQQFKDEVKIFFGQNSYFYQKMKQQWSQEMQNIKKNLVLWVQKAVQLSLKEYNRQRLKRISKLLNQ